MRKIPFIKMQGAGNDYVYINCFETPVEKLGDINILACRISDRHFGVGSDGLVLIMPSNNGADLRMRMFNSDGSEAQMCGNASRCVARFAFDNGIVNKRNFTLQTKLSNKEISVLDNGNVTVNMGSPKVGEFDTLDILGEKYNYTAVSMGNPHCVIFVDDVENFPVEKVGSIIEIHKNFPEKTNVEFARVINPETIEMRVWERGAGETLACGTGACATLTAAVVNNLSNEKAVLKLRGGNLEIFWNKSDNCIYMTGGAEKVFDGEFITQ